MAPPPHLLDLDSLFGAAAALAAVLGLIWALQRLARARQGGRGSAGGARLQRAETIALDPRRRLHLIRCDGRYVLIQTGGAQDLVVGWLPERP